MYYFKYLTSWPEKSPFLRKVKSKGKIDKNIFLINLVFLSNAQNLLTVVVPDVPVVSSQSKKQFRASLECDLPANFRVQFMWQATPVPSESSVVVVTWIVVELGNKSFYRFKNIMPKICWIKYSCQIGSRIKCLKEKIIKNQYDFLNFGIRWLVNFKFAFEM